MKNVELLEEFSEELYDELLSAQYNYACCLNELGKYEQAIEYFKKTSRNVLRNTVKTVITPLLL